MKFKRGDRIIFIKEGNSFYLKTGTVLSCDIWDSVIQLDEELTRLDEKGIYNTNDIFRFSNNFIELISDYPDNIGKNKWIKKKPD